jgi:hypothetical protein
LIKRYYKDSVTRFSKTRFVGDAKKPLQDAKERAIQRSDGLQAYQTAIPNEFYDKTANVHNPHVRIYDFETKPKTHT